MKVVQVSMDIQLFPDDERDALGILNWLIGVEDCLGCLGDEYMVVGADAYDVSDSYVTEFNSEYMSVRQISLDIQLPDDDIRNADNILNEIMGVMDCFMVIGATSCDVSDLYNSEEE